LQGIYMKANYIQYQCHICHKWFQADQNAAPLGSLNINCPDCLEMFVHKRGSGRDEGQSHIQYGPCLRCGSQTEYFSLPDGSHTVQRIECSLAYSSSSY
jgi:hypothetical protein